MGKYPLPGELQAREEVSNRKFIWRADKSEACTARARAEGVRHPVPGMWEEGTKAAGEKGGDGRRAFAPERASSGGGNWAKATLQQ